LHKIDFANLQYQHKLYQEEIETAVTDVMRQCNFIMGEPVKILEKKLQEFTSAKHAITCSSGTDALLLAMMALDIQPDDEIITTPFTFIATAETIAFLKAKPVFVDIDEKTYNIDPNKIEEKITDKTKAIISVSLYGQPADMDAIQAIADKHNLKVIIDGAQSFGSTYKGKTDSSLGDISTTSFFPAKPLGCYGDGGAVFTNNDKLADKMRSLRVHGQSKRYHHQYIGMGGRLDTIQAVVLNVKLKHYKKDLALRQEVAQKYTKALGSKTLVLPYLNDNATSAWAQYSIRVQDRDTLQAKLKEKGIPTAVHYPMPLHVQKCFEYLGYKEGDFPVAERVSKEIMSLPMNPYVKEDEIVFIVKKVLEFDN
jgi:UDP-2-acetamido-2-deoxy-ribo-hexuluronate aminotransferase